MRIAVDAVTLVTSNSGCTSVLPPIWGQNF